MIADTGGDTSAVVAAVGGLGAEVVIPPKSHRECDAVLYTVRNAVEGCVNLFKQFRRIATRYETAARNFLGMALFVAITITLR